MLNFTLLILALQAIFIASAAGHGNHRKRSLPALNTQAQNSIPNGPGGPPLFYNGSGPVPGYDQQSPVPYGFTPFKGSLTSYFVQELKAINTNNSAFDSTCQQCLASTEVLKFAAITQPVSTFTEIIIQYCELVSLPIFSVDCHAEFSPTSGGNQSAYSSDAGGVGPYWAQLYSKMSAATGDMQAWCYFELETCSLPPVIEIDESKYFTPKPASAEVAPVPSGETIDVLHLSDWHLDPRYAVGSESNCSQYLCCRPYSTNTKLDTTASNASVPASRYGALYCDAPPDLALSSFTSMGQFFNLKDVAFSIFTGDIVSHDNGDQISRAYVEYEETVTYQTFKSMLGNIPLYATLGNHDSFPEAFNTQNNIQDGSGNQIPANAFSWNYNLLSSMWRDYNWIGPEDAGYASTHYGAYAHTTAQGLRVISINTDFFYVDNIFNYYQFNDPDSSGILSWMAQELAKCEKSGQRAWVIGHVPSGYDGSNALPNPSALFYSIIARFSPATIAAVFFGHTHEDQLQIFYEYLPNSLNGTIRNTTMVDYTKPIMMGYIGPSITPLTGLNAGYQLLQIDSKTFSVMGYQTYIANVSQSLMWTTPEWEFEYDARNTYNVGGINWPSTAPLNATFYDQVAQTMLKNQSLVERYNLLETKSSVATKNCSSVACAQQKVCYIRSGSAALGRACGSKAGPF